MNLPNLLGSLRKKTFAAAAVRPAARRPRLSVETLETREVPSIDGPRMVTTAPHVSAGTPPSPILPTPTIDEQSKLSLTSGFAPVTITDPATPSQMITVFSTGTQIGGLASTDGGMNWQAFGFPGLGVDPKATTAANGVPIPYTNVGNPTAAFDKFGNFFVTYVESDAAKSSGRVVVKKFAFNAGQPIGVLASEPYRWVDNDPAFGPYVAVDTAAASYTDPQGGLGAQTDPHTTSQTSAGTTAVYVAWNQHNTAPTNPGDAVNFNPDVVRMAGSNNGGISFTAPVTVNNDWNHNATGNRYSDAKIAFTPGRAGDPTTGGKMVTLFSTGSSIASDSLSMTSTTIPRALNLNGNGGGITDAIDGTNPDIDFPQPTTFTITISAGQVPAGFVLKDIAVDLSISHQALADLSITLSGPGGSGGTLLLNKTNEDGTDSGNGTTGSQMGVLFNGNNLIEYIGSSSPVYTTFQNSAARSIHDPSSADPHIGFYRPEGVLNIGGSVVGTWTLTITDHRASNNGALLGWRLRLNGNIPLRLGADNPTGAGTLTSNFDPSAYPGKPYSLPNLPAGIGPGITVAVDNTIGGFSPYQNRIYLAYVTPITVNNAGQLVDTDVRIRYSDDGGNTWSSSGRADDDFGFDGVSSGDRFQFLPQLAVDPTTGTLGLTYYDTRWDPAGMRATTRFASAIHFPDFGNIDPFTGLPAPIDSSSWAASTYFNSTERAFDQIQFREESIEPVPSNMRTAGNDLFGNSTGLQIRNGRVVSIWAGNLDLNGTQLRTQSVDIAAGPRIIQGDQGPVIGQPTLSSFQVIFDRFVDPNSFGPADVQMRYYAPDEDPTGPGTPVAISDVSPVDDGQFGATTFTVTLQTPQTKVGVYTYRIGPDIHDRIRQSTAPGVTFNRMDQNANGTENENGPTQFDSFDAPDPVDGIPFELPYKTGTFPLVVPGPRVVSSQVIGNPTTPDNLVINKSVSSIDVTFDRNIDTTSFTTADVIRITGPIGDISGVGGVVPLRFDVPTGSWVEDPTLTQATRFRIKFPAQVLSGTYRIQLSANIQDMNGNKLDTNQNAGLSTFMGSVPTGGVPDVAHYDAGTLSVAIAPNSVTTVPIDVPDSFVLQKVVATLSITYPDMRQLEGRLLAPDGTSVLLFKGVPQVGSSFANMTNTTFDDDALTAIQQGIAPFANSAFNPVQPLSQMIGHASRSSTGKFRLMITNKGTSSGTITRFTLDLSRFTSGTGLGEPAADQASVGFRIFQTDPTSDVVKGTWTPVGPTQVQTKDPFGNIIETSAAGRVGAIAVDPSDPSGNTVFVAGSTGGVWKTTNFMTHDPAGPTYVNLTDFGSTNAINVGSIAVWNNTNDPTKSFIIVGTGSDSINQDFQHLPISANGTADGVGFLVSEDGGKNWRVLDSTVNNSPTFPFPALPFSDTGRDHLFVGAVVNKVVLDPVLDPQTTRPTIYAAVGQGTTGNPKAAGLWRSSDGGRTWLRLADPNNPAIVNQLPAGDVTDVVLAAASADKGIGSTQQPQIVYAAVRGHGVYMSVNRGGGFTPMLGLVGKPLIRDDDPDVLDQRAVPVNNPAGDPNGSKALISLATPVLAKAALANTYYAGWLAVAVSNATGNLDGLYITKDFGGNWTKIRLPDKLTNPDFIIPTNDETQPDFDPANGAGQSELQVTFDPNDPNIVYLGSDMVVRADITNINDPHKLVTYEHSNNDGGQIRPDTTGGTQVKHRETENPLNPNFRRPGLQLTDPFGNFRDDPLSGAFYEDALRSLDQSLTGPADTGQTFWNYVNLFRDPQQPFPNAVTNATLFVRNEDHFLNDGTDVHWFYVTDQALNDADVVPSTQSKNDLNAINRMLTVVDPITGLGRLIYGDDHGVHTVVMNPDVPVSNNYDYVGWIGGKDYQINGDRNGNLQIAEFHGGAVQPSLLAAEIAGALFYGVGHIPQDAAGSDPHMVETGRTTTGDQLWNGDTRRGPANWVETDPTGTGTVFILRRPTDTTIATDFFQVVLPGTNTPIGRVGSQSGASLLEAGDNPYTGQGQWDLSVDRFTVNPFSHTSGGTDATAIGVAISSKTGNIFRTIDTGLHWAKIFHTPDNSYAPAVAYGAPAPNDPFVHNYLYVGTTAGHVYVTKDGFTTDQDITLNLDGSNIQQIVPSTVRGSNAVYVLTRDHIYYMADWTVTGAQWTDITGNLFALTHAAFGNPDWTIPLLTRLNTIAVDWRSSFTGNPTFPVLYAGGDGGVFRSLDNGTTWSQFPANAVVPGVVGGNLPVTNVTRLELSIGDFNGDTGQFDSNGARDLLVATTFGRGTFETSIGRPDAALGPQVLSAVRAPGDDVIGPLAHFRVTFSEAMDPSSFTAADFVKITGPNGAIDPTTIGISVTAVPNTGQEVFDVAFNTQSNDGIYTFTFGPFIATPSGVFMDQNQNGVKGEVPGDSFTTQFVVGVNDVSDYIRDSFNDLLGRDPTTAEFLSKNAQAIDTARFSALSVILKELLSTYNSDPTLNGTVGEARQVLVERLFRINGSFSNEIGNLDPTFFNTLTTQQQTDLVNGFVNQLKAGTTTPERIILTILTDPTLQYRGALSNAEYVDKVFNDLLGRPGTTAEHTKYDTMVGTVTGSKTFVGAVVNGTPFRDRLTGFLYQKYLGRAPSTTEKSAARTLLGLAPVANALQGSERVVQKILASRQFFSLQTQTEPAGGATADNGLHTNRSWIEGVFSARFVKTTGELFGRPPATVGPPRTYVSTTAERNLFSGKILARYTVQRNTFERALVSGTEFRTLTLKALYKQVFGLTLTDQTTITKALNALALGATFQSITAGWLGSTDFYNLAPALSGQAAPSRDTWAKAVLVRMLGVDPTQLNNPPFKSEWMALSAKAGTTVTSRTAAAMAVLNGTATAFPNGNEYRDNLIKAAFNLILHRPPSTNELTAYENFLKTNRWEFMLSDLMANGKVDLDPNVTGVQNSLPQEFWEIAD